MTKIITCMIIMIRWWWWYDDSDNHDDNDNGGDVVVVWWWWWWWWVIHIFLNYFTVKHCRFVSRREFPCTVPQEYLMATSESFHYFKIIDLQPHRDSCKIAQLCKKKKSTQLLLIYSPPRSLVPKQRSAAPQIFMVGNWRQCCLAAAVLAVCLGRTVCSVPYCNEMMKWWEFKQMKHHTCHSQN